MAPMSSDRHQMTAGRHLRELSDIAKTLGGCVKPGEIYKGAKVKMVFIDADGHEFELEPWRVKAGRWSPFAQKKTSNPEAVRLKLIQAARLHGGELRADQVYETSHLKLVFVDFRGEEFSLRPSAVLQGRWPKKRRPHGREEHAKPVHKKQYERLSSIAASEGGYILEGQQYFGPETPMVLSTTGVVNFRRPRRVYRAESGQRRGSHCLTIISPSFSRVKSWPRSGARQDMPMLFRSKPISTDASRGI